MVFKLVTILSYTPWSLVHDESDSRKDGTMGH